MSAETISTCPGADDPEERCPKHPSECTCWEVDNDHPMRRLNSAKPAHEDEIEAMTADTITAIKKLAERVFIAFVADPEIVFPNIMGQHRIRKWSIEPFDGGTEYVPASALESLQRENEELRQDLKDATEIIEAQNQDHASNNIRFAENAHRAEAAEAEVKRMRKALETAQAEASDATKSTYAVAASACQRIYAITKSALSSTGDTHGN